MKLIECVEAVQFNGVMSHGRTTPLLLTCERADGTSTEVVVKFATGLHCTYSSLCAELIASQLAADLGLPTPSPVFVKWEQAFVDSLVDLDARKIVGGSKPPAFGSTFVTNGFTTWPTNGRLIGEPMRQVALAIFFFDAMIGNSDRGGMKPNILVKGDAFRLIDHEMSFQDYRLFTKPTPPWVLGGLNGMVTNNAHIFATALVKTREKFDYDPIREAWAGLSDRQIESYATALPAEWTVENNLSEFAVGRIKECRNQINECIAECKRAFDVGS